MEIEVYLPFLHTDMIRIEIQVLRLRLIAQDPICIAFHALLQLRLQSDAVLHNQSAGNQSRVVRKRLTIGFRRTVYIQMVGIYRRHHRHIRP